MNLLLQSVVLLPFAASLAVGQHAPQGKPVSVTNQPETLVSNLYTQVVSRHPLGIPDGADKRIFAPYLSTALLHEMDLRLACSSDFYKQHPSRDLKGPGSFSDIGIFSGSDDHVFPQAFHIEGIKHEKDGSFRVDVRLSMEMPNEKPDIWYMAVIVTQESGRFVVSDVISLKSDPQGNDSRLSEGLSEGCDGPRWIGYGNQKRQPCDMLPKSRAEPSTIFEFRRSGDVEGQAYGITDDRPAARLKLYPFYKATWDDGSG